MADGVATRRGFDFQLPKRAIGGALRHVAERVLRAQFFEQGPRRGLARFRALHLVDRAAGVADELGQEVRERAIDRRREARRRQLGVDAVDQRSRSAGATRPASRAACGWRFRRRRTRRGSPAADSTPAPSATAPRGARRASAVPSDTRHSIHDTGLMSRARVHGNAVRTFEAKNSSAASSSGFSPASSASMVREASACRPDAMLGLESSRMQRLIGARLVADQRELLAHAVFVDAEVARR